MFGIKMNILTINQIVRGLVILIITIMAVVGDLKNYKIKNRLIAGMLFISAVFLIYEVLSGKDCINYMKGGIAGFLITFAIYIVRGIGAGDAKFISVLGLLTGISTILKIILYSLICGAVIGLCSMCINRKRKAIKVFGDTKNINVHVFHFSLAIMASEIITAYQILK